MSIQERHKKRQDNVKDRENSRKDQPSSKNIAQDAIQEETSSSEEESVLTRTKLDLSNHPLPPFEKLSKTLAHFSQLQKLDISGMKASEENPHGLTSLQWLGRATRKGKGKAAEGTVFGDKLTWLKMSDNPFFGQQGRSEIWDGIEFLTSLSVLNASSCNLTTAPPASALLRITSLAALVLAHNSISSISYMPHLPHLNTLVLSHNKICKLPKGLAANLPSLKKLSITHNFLEWTNEECPLPDFTQCSHLREVRLSGNNKLIKLPSHLKTWGRGQGRDRLGTGLETLELADCGLNDWVSIEPLMKMVDLDDPPRRRRGLGNLSLKGNPVTSLSDFHEKILEVHQALRTLDGEKTIERKKEVRSGDSTLHASSTPEAAVNLSAKAKQGQRRANKLLNDKIGKNIDGNGRDREVRGQIKEKERTAGGAKVEKSGTQLEKADQEEKIKQVKPRSGRKDSRAKEQETRALGRAGPPPPAPKANGVKEKILKHDLKSKPQSKSTKEAIAKNSAAVIKEKKRKAWDEGATDDSEKKRKEAGSDSLLERRVKDQTSVAAVIQLNKKKPQEDKVVKSIWGQVGGTEASLGVGSAWE